MLCSRDFFNKSKYNNETKEQMWTSIIGDAHDAICDCNFPFSHLLATIFPPGHTDRDKSINDILLRDYKEKCRSSGGGDAVLGFLAGNTTEQKDIEEKDGQREEDEELAGLLAAAEKEDAAG